MIVGKCSVFTLVLGGSRSRSWVNIEDSILSAQVNHLHIMVDVTWVKNISLSHIISESVIKVIVLVRERLIKYGW